ncbi:MAG: helix-turn-helix domain-containing protein [Amphritea sp.]|jgi:transcriptional regulator GlxA family with amidase domain|nr:helix-turn-helix domain-containing protein [Amphritea sp.]
MTDADETLPPIDMLINTQEPNLRVAFVLSPFFSMLSFSAFVDVLRLAGDTADRSQMNLCHWTVVSNNNDNICASSGIEIAPKKLITEVSYDDFDYIVVVGGILRGSYILPDALGEFIQRGAEHGLPIVGICTGSFIMAELGLLEGYRCSIHFQHFNEFTEKYSAPLPLSDQTYTVDRDRFTSIGGAAPAYLAAELVKKHCGPLLARKALKLVILDYGNDEQSKTHIGNQFADIVLQVNDVRVRRAVAMMEKTIAEPLEIREISQQLNVTMRQLNKAFMDSLNVTPSDFYRDMRIRHAEWLLTNSARSITLISQECGFADSAHLTRWFKRKYNESPKHYRHRREEAIHLQKDSGSIAK